MTLTAPGSLQADSHAGGPVPPCPARGKTSGTGSVQSMQFHSYRGAEGHGPVKPLKPPTAIHRSGRCQFRPARHDGPARGR